MHYAAMIITIAFNVLFDWFQAADVVHVEMDESDVTIVLRKLQDIETHIHRFTNGEKS